MEYSKCEHTGFCGKNDWIKDAIRFEGLKNCVNEWILIEFVFFFFE